MSSVAEEGKTCLENYHGVFSAHISLLLYEIQYFIFYISYHDISHTNIVWNIENASARPPHLQCFLRLGSSVAMLCFLSFLRVGCSVLVCIWGAAGWFWRRFGSHFSTFLDKFRGLGAPFLVILRVWRMSGEAFRPHLESDSNKYENKPKNDARIAPTWEPLGVISEAFCV